MTAKITWRNRQQAVRQLAYAYIWEWHDNTGDVEFAAELALKQNAAFTTGNVKPSNRRQILAELHRDAKAYASTHYKVLRRAMLAEVVS